MYKIKDLRKQNNLTQQEIADKLNIKRQQYARYEKQQTEIPLKYIIDIADYYNKSVDYILNREV